MKYSILLIALIILSCNNNKKNKVTDEELVHQIVSIQKEKDEEKNVNENKSGQPEIQFGIDTTIHYESDDSDFGKTHLKIHPNNSFEFIVHYYEQNDEFPEEINELTGTWTMNMDSIVTLNFKDNGKVNEYFKSDNEVRSDFTLIDSTSVYFDLKNTDLDVLGFNINDFKRNCYCK